MPPEPDFDDLDALFLEVEIQEDARSVWSALVDDEQRREWWPDLALRAELGGALLEDWRDDEGNQQRTRGQVLDLEPERRLRCSWQDDGWPAATEVDILLDGGVDSTRVALRHSGWQALPAAQHLRDAHRTGWSMHLANLKSFVESGGSWF